MPYETVEQAVAREADEARRANKVAERQKAVVDDLQARLLLALSSQRLRGYAELAAMLRCSERTAVLLSLGTRRPNVSCAKRRTVSPCPRPRRSRTTCAGALQRLAPATPRRLRSEQHRSCARSPLKLATNQPLCSACERCLKTPMRGPTGLAYDTRTEDGLGRRCHALAAREPARRGPSGRDRRARWSRARRSCGFGRD